MEIANKELLAMDKLQQPVESQYEAAIAEERLLWKQLDEPQVDVNEQMKACARWSAAADRARAMALRLRDSAVTVNLD
jgi:hypothetical protein